MTSTMMYLKKNLVFKRVVEQLRLVFLPLLIVVHENVLEPHLHAVLAADNGSLGEVGVVDYAEDARGERVHGAGLVAQTRGGCGTDLRKTQYCPTRSLSFRKAGGQPRKGRRTRFTQTNRGGPKASFIQSSVHEVAKHMKRASLQWQFFNHSLVILTRSSFSTCPCSVRP